MLNIFRDIPAELTDELFQTLVRGEGVRIERIVSRGHLTPAGDWYDQDENEWVLLLRGGARLAFADGSEASLGEGDCLDIPAHLKHRVAWTDPARETVWLAVHYTAPTGNSR
jgi:cupin 2 domain-containing protein